MMHDIPPQTLPVLFDLCITQEPMDMRNLASSALRDAIGYLVDKQLVVIDYADDHAWAVPTNEGAELLTTVLMESSQLL